MNRLQASHMQVNTKLQHVKEAAISKTSDGRESSEEYPKHLTAALLWKLMSHTPLPAHRASCSGSSLGKKERRTQTRPLAALQGSPLCWGNYFFVT